MARTKLIGTYEKFEFVLKNEDGDEVRRIKPDEIFRIGNSQGGYWAKPIRYAGKPMLALVRLTGSQMYWRLEEIQQEFAQTKGEILREQAGLWATSSGSARRGVWHRVKVPKNAVEEVFQKHRIPTNIKVVGVIDHKINVGGASLRWINCQGGSCTDSSGDGTYQGKYWDEGKDFSYGVRHYKGGTFVVIGCRTKGSGSCVEKKVPTQVIMTREADPNAVAKALAGLVNRL